MIVDGEDHQPDVVGSAELAHEKTDVEPGQHEGHERRGEHEGHEPSPKGRSGRRGPIAWRGVCERCCHGGFLPRATAIRLDLRKFGLGMTVLRPRGRRMVKPSSTFSSKSSPTELHHGSRALGPRGSRARVDMMELDKPRQANTTLLYWHESDGLVNPDTTAAGQACPGPPPMPAAGRPNFEVPRRTKLLKCRHFAAGWA